MRRPCLFYSVRALQALGHIPGGIGRYFPQALVPLLRKDDSNRLVDASPSSPVQHVPYSVAAGMRSPPAPQAWPG